ncbi:MAG: hypothetical protein HQL45_04960 [Alphaproteobacteria bacterium]|nr:hypothetical protein [Alphaproteobacteria bacterium]
MANNSTLIGMTINQSYGGGVVSAWGVTADGVSGATISNNKITINHASSNAFGVRAVTNSSSIIVSGNTISVTNTNGHAYGLQVTGTSSATVTGNTFSADGTLSDRAIYLANATIQSGSTGNAILAGTCNNAGGNTGSIGLTDGTTCP